MALCIVLSPVMACRPAGAPAGAATQSLAELQRLAASPEASPAAHLAYGEKLARENRPAEAVQEFQRAERRLEPGQSDATAAGVYARLAYALAYIGNREAASAYLEGAPLEGGRVAPVPGRGRRSRMHRREVKDAIALAQRAVALRPRSYEAHDILGLCHNDDRDPGAAESELKTATALAPEFGAAQAELGHCYAYQTRYDAAAQQFRIARRLEPSSRDYLFALGEALGLGAHSPEQYREAVAVQEECLRASPNNAALLFSLGQLHLRFMDLQAAQQALQRACDLGAKQVTSLYDLARVAQLRGDTATAKNGTARFATRLAIRNRRILAEKGVAAKPRDPHARITLARAFHAEGNRKGCHVQLKAALALDPASPDAQIVAIIDEGVGSRAARGNALSSHP